MTMTKCVRGAFAVFLCVFWAGMASAQTWLQIEAQPNETTALERANDYARAIENVGSYRLRSGWYAIVIGPFIDENDARGALLQLRGQRAIPGDSFLADGSNFRAQIFGSGDVVAVAPATPEIELAPLVAGEETPGEARASERRLNREERELIQIALRWEGVYNSIIDASFGPGTRRAMASWQEMKRYEPTGILTTLQRRELVEAYQAVLRGLDLRPVVDVTAGVEVDMPSALVTFDAYQSPFAQYKAASDDGVRVLLISQSGDDNTLSALFDVMQTLEVVPMEGPRKLGRNDFSIEGTDNKLQSYTYARLTGGTVKGFSLIWPAGDERRFRTALDAMRASFAPIDGVLPDTAGAVQDIDLMAGLEIRRADRARSGFFIDTDGAVLTTAEAVRQCTRILLNDEVPADIVASSDALGVALLRPREPLAPLSVARLAIGEPRLQSSIAVAGYSFGGLLSAPSLTYGTLADVKGLDGNRDVQRLAVVSEASDAGGPVFDTFGAVAGLLLDAPKTGRQLPADVAFAADAPVLAAFLTENGVSPAALDPENEIAPEDLTLLAADVTVLVSCWN